MRLRVSLLLFFCFSSFLWAQPPHTFTTPGTGTFKVPAGVLSLDIECWGAGGAGGGVSAVVSVFGGGGGGGGAYGKFTLGVFPATTLNYKVGAGGVGINGTDGPNGEASNFSTVSANGGEGGKNGNSANGLGGSGGLASGIGVNFSGGNGAAGNLVGTILPLLSSGGGGGSAGTAASGNNANASGVSGGAAVAGGGKGGDGMAVLGGGNGNNGVSPGGGGGGALGLLLSNFKGGNGGNGQIKVTYNCPVYGLSGTSGADVCAATGSTSLVTLTGSTLTLPVGDYVVTYNRSNPSAIGLTATMSVGGAGGSGNFTAIGLNITGSSTITITNLTSESCTNTITSNNTVTITISSASVGGTINTPASICSGGTSGLLTLSGHTGTVSGWEYSVSPFSSWLSISNTTTTYAPGVLTQTTRFRAVVKNGACDAVNSAFTTVTVNPLPTITSPGVINDVCFSSGAQIASLPYTATTNNPISYSIVWNPAANSAGLTNQVITPFTFLAGGGNLTTIVVPAAVPANTYSGTMTIINANCTAVLPVQLTVKPTPGAPTIGTITQPTCALLTGSVILNGLPPSVTWLIKQTGTASTTYTNTGTSYTISNLAVGNYTFTIEYTGSCISSPSSNVAINGLVTNTYNGSWSSGSPTINQNLIFASNYASAGGGAGNISGCSCTVNSGVNVVMNSDDTLTIANAVVNNSGTLTFENNASLLQTTNAVNSGNIIYKRTSAPMKNFDFTYWSSPVSGQTLFNLSPNTLSDKYFSYTGTSWQQEVATTTVMIPGKGYIIRTPKEGLWGNGENVLFPYFQPVQFVGIPNNGNISGGSVTMGNFYLIGNPYPSALNADAFLYTNINNSGILDGTIYLWTHNTAIQPNGSVYSYNTSDYATYNGVGGVGTLPAYLGGAVPSGKIAAGQSFFAVAKGTGVVEFNNSMRVSGNNNQFFKPGKTAKPNLLEKHRVWLNMTNTQGAFKQTLIGYIEGATNGIDSDFDGVSLDGNPFIDFYSVNSGINLVIQGRALPFSDTDEVQLGYRTTITGDFTISIDHADGLLTNQAVFLHDHLTNTVHNLSVSSYTFATVSGTFKNRFLIKYNNRTLTVNDYESNDNSVLVWRGNENITINSNAENIDKIFVYDLLGKKLFEKQNVDNTRFVINNFSSIEQIVLVKIFLKSSNVVTKKIILK